MKYRQIINKVLRRFSLKAGGPCIKETIFKKILPKRKITKQFNVDYARNILDSSITSQEMLTLDKYVSEIEKGYLHIFDESPIKRDNGVFITHPRTGHLEPLKSWCRVKLNKKGDEDIKFLWELNRLNDLDSLVTMALLKHDPKHIDLCFDIVNQWERENPFGKGPNWSSNMEVAIRLIRLLLLHGVSQNYEMDNQRLFNLIHLHWLHVISDWKSTRKTTTGNHLLVEVAALALYECLTYTAGPGRKNIKHECARQFLYDGGNFEGSIGYHGFVFNVLCQVEFICNAFGVKSPIPKDVQTKASYFLNHASSSNGLAFGIGDWDDGFVFRPVPSHPRDFSFQIRFASKVLDHEEAQMPMPSNGLLIFADSGMVFKKISDTELLFRAAPVVYGHSHLDMLSINWIVDKQPVILDSGTYQYNRSKETRDYFRSLQAHSTIIPEVKWPVKPLGTFSWRGSLYPELLTLNFNELLGKYTLNNGYFVSRKVNFTREGFILYDYCSCPQDFFSQFIVYGVESSDDEMFFLDRTGQRAATVNSGNSAYGFEECIISERYGQKIKAGKIFFKGISGQELRIEVKIYREKP